LSPRAFSQEGAGGAEDDDNLCPICCAAPSLAKFIPCDHSSCLRCIRRQVLKEARCFYCKGQVTAILDTSTGQTTPVEPPHVS